MGMLSAVGMRLNRLRGSQRLIADLPPDSSNKTLFPASESRRATTQPAEPALTNPASPHFSIDDLCTTRARQRAERAERRAKEAEEKARRKRLKEEREEEELAQAYERSRFRFKPPSVRCALYTSLH